MQNEDYSQTEEAKKTGITRKIEDISQGCKLRLLMLNQEGYPESIKEGNEIIISKKTHNIYSGKPDISIQIFYKNKDGEVGSVTCDEDLKNTLSLLNFNGNILSVDQHLEIYEKIYDVVTSNGGYAHTSNQTLTEKRLKARRKLIGNRTNRKEEIKSLLIPYKLSETENNLLENGYARFREPFNMSSGLGINVFELTYQDALFRKDNEEIYSLVKEAYNFRIRQNEQGETEVGQKNVAVVCIRHFGGSVSMEPAISGGGGPPGHSERLALRKAINKAIFNKRPEFNGLPPMDESIKLDKSSIFSPYLNALKECRQIDIFSDRGPCDSYSRDKSMQTCDVFFKDILKELKNRFFFAVHYAYYHTEGMNRSINTQFYLFKKITENTDKNGLNLDALIKKLNEEKKEALESSSSQNRSYFSTGSSPSGSSFPRPLSSSSSSSSSSGSSFPRPLSSSSSSSSSSGSSFTRPPSSSHILSFNSPPSIKPYVDQLEPLLNAIRSNDSDVTSNLVKSLNIKIISEVIEDAINQISDKKDRNWMKILIETGIKTNNEDNRETPAPSL